jgi:hypothetical protein
MSSIKNRAPHVLEPGKVYGNLTILGKNPSVKGAVNALCSCGNLCSNLQRKIALGRIKSCGCLCGAPKHGLRKTREYDLWRSIKKRCYHPEHRFYARYGGRGIKMYEPWLQDPLAFYTYLTEVLGPKPSPKHSLDRIDNDGNYCPGNLRWASKKEQVYNSSTIKTRLTFNNKCQTIPEWANELKLDKALLYRLKAKGWSDNDILCAAIQRQQGDNKQ